MRSRLSEPKTRYARGPRRRRDSCEDYEPAEGQVCARPGASNQYMLTILPPAFASALYPTLLAGVVIILSRPRPLPLLIGFLCGGWAASMTAGLIIVFALRGVTNSSSVKKSSPFIDFAIGMLSLVLAGLLWLRHSRRAVKSPVPPRQTGQAEAGKSRSTRTERLLSHGSPWVAFLLGVALNAPGMWYLVALKEIIKGSYSDLTVVLLLVLFNLIMFLLAEIPLVSYLINPGWTGTRVQLAQRWLAVNGWVAGVVVTSAIGVYLLIKATLQWV